MDHEGLAGVVRQGDLRLERTLLILPGRMHPEEVEAALPHGQHAGVVQELLDASPSVPVERARVVGVHACRGEHTLDRIGQLERPTARFGVHADADQAIDARGLRGLDHT